jgi:hypothetical protein
MVTSQVEQTPISPALGCEEILRIAQRDAEAVYSNLVGYRITLELQLDGWHVDYELTEPLAAGGGPHYVIDAVMGTILRKEYEQ